MIINLGIGLHWHEGSLDEFISTIEYCESLGYKILWISNEKFFRDMYVLSTLAATRTTKPRIGTFVADPYTQHPALTATAIGTLDEVSNGRAVLCLGAGGTGFPPMGIQRVKPALAIKEAILLIRQLLTAQPVDFVGKVIQFRHGRLNFQPRTNIPIYVASRGDRVLQCAGEVADGVMIATYAEPFGIQHAIRMVEKGAANANRSIDDLTLISRVDTCIDDDRRAAIDSVKPMVGVFLWTSYPDRKFVHRVGLEVPEPLESIIAQREYNLMAQNVHLIPDDFVEKFCWAGTAYDIVEKVSQVVELGIRNITFLPHAPKGGSTLTTIRSFAEIVKPRIESAFGM